MNGTVSQQELDNGYFMFGATKEAIMGGTGEAVQRVQEALKKASPEGRVRWRLSLNKPFTYKDYREFLLLHGYNIFPVFPPDRENFFNIKELEKAINGANASMGLKVFPIN